MKTTDVLEEYNVSRQSLYNWVKYDNLNIDRDIRGHYIRNEKSILDLKEFIADRKERNIDTSNKCVETRFGLKNRRYLGAKTRLLPIENSKKFSSSSLISEVDDSYSSVRKKNFDMEWRVDIIDKVN